MQISLSPLPPRSHRAAALTQVSERLWVIGQGEGLSLLGRGAPDQLVEDVVAALPL